MHRCVVSGQEIAIEGAVERMLQGKKPKAQVKQEQASHESEDMVLKNGQVFTVHQKRGNFKERTKEIST